MGPIASRIFVVCSVVSCELSMVSATEPMNSFRLAQLRWRVCPRRASVGVCRVYFQKARGGAEPKMVSVHLYLRIEAKNELTLMSGRG